MLSVHQAQKKILECVPAQRKPEELPLEAAAGRYLAKDVFSKLDSPRFDNSAMDGYALKSEDTRKASSQSPVILEVSGLVPAGHTGEQALTPGTALRIFTGAPLPPGADTVVRQEDVQEKDGQLCIVHPVVPDSHVRHRGEELKSGQRALHAGAPLTPATLAFLKGLGLQTVKVCPLPRVGILVTGSELVDHPEDLGPAKIMESNSLALRAGLMEMGIAAYKTARVGDEAGKLAAKLSELLECSDFLLVTGGVSVGDFDFVRSASGTLGVEEVFWKVNQKPGKPIFFGRAGEKLLFGLPGNPASVMVCFYEYVRPALLKFQGGVPLLPRVRARLKQNFRKKGARTHFVRAEVDFSRFPLEVGILQKQGSHQLQSFALANALAVFPGEVEEFSKGQEVECHLLPGVFLNSGVSRL